MNNKEEEIGYWKRLVDTASSFLPIRGKKDLEFRDRLLGLLGVHIERLKNGLGDEYYYLSPGSKYWLHYWLIKGEDIDRVVVERCSYCALREKCMNECISYEPMGGLFVAWKDWVDFMSRYSRGYIV